MQGRAKKGGGGGVEIAGSEYSRGFNFERGGGGAH